eukprot:5011547-Prymnesium_polylepis.1
MKKLEMPFFARMPWIASGYDEYVPTCMFCVTTAVGTRTRHAATSPKLAAKEWWIGCSSPPAGARGGGMCELSRPGSRRRACGACRAVWARGAMVRAWGAVRARREAAARRRWRHSPLSACRRGFMPSYALKNIDAPGAAPSAVAVTPLYTPLKPPAFRKPPSACRTRGEKRGTRSSSHAASLAVGVRDDLSGAQTTAAAAAPAAGFSACRAGTSPRRRSCRPRRRQPSPA